MTAHTDDHVSRLLLMSDSWVSAIEASYLVISDSANYNAYTASRKVASPQSPKEGDTIVPELVSSGIIPNTNTQTLNSDDIHPHGGTAITINEGVVILEGLLESSPSPNTYLRELRKHLKANVALSAIIVSSDYEKSGEINDKSRLPSNESHYRGWSLERLAVYLKSSGFTIARAGHYKNHAIIEVTATEESHRALLRSYALPAPKDSIIITTEHADTKSTGGIGSYVKEVELVTGDNRPIVLTMTSQPFSSTMTTASVAENIIDIHTIVEHPSTTAHTSDWNSSSIAAYQAIKLLTFLYDQIRVIEYQEYQGIGSRIAQAKAAGELPADVTLVARCHGSQVYIDRASFDWSGMEKGDEFELERLSIDLADEVSFPTKYLRDLYLSTGYNIRDDNSYVLRLPYSYPTTQKANYADVSQLIFLGKRSVMKGFPSFCKVVDDITDPSSTNYNKNIVRVRALAAPGDASEPYDQELATLCKKRGIELQIGPVPRHEVLEILGQSAENSIVCLPYGGDNHPVTILEMIANRCRFVAFASGGIPELVPHKYATSFLCEANADDMATKVNALAMLPLNEVSKLMNGVYGQAIKDQLHINDKVCQSYTTRVAKKAATLMPENGLATVMVPIYGTDLRYVLTVIKCLNQQSYQPYEVLFINDCTPSKAYVTKLHKLIREHANIPYRIIDHPVNRGLAGARNTGLANCNTKYLINVDSDDVVSNDFVYDYVHFMENNPEYSACTSALASFTDEDGWNRRPLEADYSYVGIGSCFVLGVSKNIFGHAGSCVLTTNAKQLGGWDESDRSKWEDWAFFLKMTSSGMQIFNFPKVNYFYRVSANSMVRTYANYPAEMRIARNISGLSIWESHRLYAFIKDEAERTGGGGQLIEPETLTYRIAKRASSVLNKAPYAKRVLKKGISASWDVFRKIKPKA
jgi:glycosyltransferase involved in cell wall biosynthesis